MPTIFFTFWEKLKKPWWSVLPRILARRGIMDHPYDFLEVQKFSSILNFECQNVVLEIIFQGLAHFSSKILFFSDNFCLFSHTENVHSLLTEKLFTDKIKAS